MQYEVPDKVLIKIHNSFTYHPPNEEQGRRYESLRHQAGVLAVAILTHTPQSREQALAITNLEQAIMWANKAIACNEG